MKLIELLIDDTDNMSGIQAISVVESPAIIDTFVTLSKQQVLLKTDNKRGVLVGPALIPNKKILRRDKDGNDYEIFFSKETVRKASEGFLIKGNQSEATLEHEEKLTGLTVVESWIVEGKNDKSKDLGMNVPEGTWMVSMKATPEIYAKAQSGEVKGFSIEGVFADDMEAKMQKEQERQVLIEQLKNILKLKTIDKQK